MATSKEQLQQQLDDLRKWADDTKKAVTDNKEFKDLDKNAAVPATVLSALATRADEVPFQNYLELSGLKALLPAARPAIPEETNTIQFENFLERMSKTMVTAQRQLDSESGQYLTEIASDQKKRHVLPSVFRLPKLSAQMKFALDVEDKKSLNLIFFRHEGTTTSRNEQSIDFDIVSIPAPPDAAAAVQAIGPRLDLLLDPFERGKVLDAVRAAAPADTGLGPIIDAANDTPEQVLIVALMQEKDMQRYLLLASDPAPDADDHAVGMWLAVFPDAGPPSLETIYRLTRKNGPGERGLKSVVAAVAARQKEFLAG